MHTETPPADGCLGQDLCMTWSTCANYVTEKNKEVPLTNIIACTTNAALAVHGRYEGFISHLKKEVLGGMLTNHGAVYWQPLIGNNIHLGRGEIKLVLYYTLFFIIFLDVV